MTYTIRKHFLNIHPSYTQEVYYIFVKIFLNLKFFYKFKKMSYTFKKIFLIFYKKIIFQNKFGNNILKCNFYYFEFNILFFSYLIYIYIYIYLFIYFYIFNILLIKIVNAVRIVI